MQSFVYFVLVSLLFSDKAMVRNVILAAYLKKFSIVAIKLKTLLSNIYEEHYVFKNLVIHFMLKDLFMELFSRRR